MRIFRKPDPDDPILQKVLREMHEAAERAKEPGDVLEERRRKIIEHEKHHGCRVITLNRSGEITCKPRLQKRVLTWFSLQTKIEVKPRSYTVRYLLEDRDNSFEYARESFRAETPVDAAGIAAARARARGGVRYELEGPFVDVNDEVFAVLFSWFTPVALFVLIILFELTRWLLVHLAQIIGEDNVETVLILVPIVSVVAYAFVAGLWDRWKGRLN